MELLDDGAAAAASPTGNLKHNDMASASLDPAVSPSKIGQAKPVPREAEGLRHIIADVASSRASQ